MNVKLVESLATIIDSLTPEEKQILQCKIQEKKSVKHSLDEFINITRDERTAAQDELIYNCFVVSPNLPWVKLV